MTSLRSFQQKLAKVYRAWEEEQYDSALSEVDAMLAVWPGNAPLHLLFASLVQLQDNPAHGLDAVKKALQNAILLDKNAPSGPIELGQYLDAVEDDPQAALKAFSEGVLSARRLLIDGLLGQSRTLLQLGKRDEALKCLMESLYLANMDSTPETGKTVSGTPDILLRDPAGSMLAFQVKGPFAIRIEELLQELFPKRSA